MWDFLSELSSNAEMFNKILVVHFHGITMNGAWSKKKVSEHQSK